RSRNTTPISAVAKSPTTSPAISFFNTTLSPLGNSRTFSDIFTASGGGSANTIPSATQLQGIRDGLQTLMDGVKTRGDKYDRLMRELSKTHREREQQEQARIASEKEAEERRRVKEKERQAKEGKVSKKRGREEDSSRPLAVGAHQPARQDGMDQDNSSEISSPASPAPPSLIGTAEGVKSPKSDGSSPTSPHQPTPAPAINHFQLFGEDPNKFPDPTIYHIRDVTPGMSEAEKLEIFSVKSYPHDDLVRLTAGTPPDQDFSKAKEGQKQSVSAQQFANFVEPFIRPLNDEDVAFLRERGDRVEPFQTPPRDKKSYKLKWAEEDGAMAIDNIEGPGLPQNQARGSMEDMNDMTAEGDDISCGPVLSRVLQTLRPGRPPKGSHGAETNGDATMVNGITNGDVDGDGDMPMTNGDTSHHQYQQPATFMPESTTAAWKNAFGSAAGDPPPNIDERLVMELKHIGFLPEDVTINESQYNAAEDDNVAARLRYLQRELRRQGIINGARKERVLELTQGRMAMQEYMSIADDLDNQLNQAYLKRTKNMSKKGKQQPKKSSSGQHQGSVEPAGVARTTLGDPIKNLLERKAKWNGWIGPVVDDGLSKIPKESIFPSELMRELEKAEAPNW
ncbi:hypothetical protein NA57DRAFT_28587, partial [Rhizodiscina lignyota]